MRRAYFSLPRATKPTIRATSATCLPGRPNWNPKNKMAAEIKAPVYRIFPIAPAIEPGSMAETKSFVASDKIQEAIGFPGQLVDDWHDRAIARRGDLLD